MISNRATDISGFFAIGINYKKSNASTRGAFAVSPEQYESLLREGPRFGIREFFILSTCNRTEVYGFAENGLQLASLLCSQTKGDLETFRRLWYCKQGLPAVQHLFEVGAGLDSQILGDYEIVGQIRSAVKLARNHQRIGSFLDRLVNVVLQSSKAVKNETSLSGGTISVSFAAIQYIRENITDISSKNILLIGTGKIGRNTCKNLVDYLSTRNITLINRSEEKATGLAHELGLKAKPIESLSNEIHNADIILVATNAEAPVVMLSDLLDSREKLVIDLSIPNNVEESAAALPHITLVNVDDLSRINDETLAKRRAEVPKAKQIIAKHLAEFTDWLSMRKHAPVLRAIKTKLEEIHTSPLFQFENSDYILTGSEAGEKIQRVINVTASKFRNQNQGGCYYIEAINDFIAAEIR